MLQKMKEIKFRIYDEHEKEMYYSDRDNYMTKNGNNVSWSIGCEGNILVTVYDGEHGFLLDGELMQFVYEKDSNGTDIYEGDIVRCWPEGWPTHKDVFVDSIVNTDVMKLLKECRIKRVIGNVHEHKELLRQRAAL